MLLQVVVRCCQRSHFVESIVSSPCHPFSESPCLVLRVVRKITPAVNEAKNKPASQGKPNASFAEKVVEVDNAQQFALPTGNRQYRDLVLFHDF